MNKVIRVIQGANRVLTCGKNYPNLTILDQPMGWKGREEKEKRGRNLGEKSSTFSLGFSEIGLAVPSRARRKVLPLVKGFKERPETRSFDKLQELGLLLLWLFSTLRAVWLCFAPRGMFGCILNHGKLP